MAKGANVRLTELETSSHLTHLPFIVDTTNPAALRAMVDLAYAKNAEIEGESSSQVADREYAEMLSMPPQPMLGTLVDELLNSLRFHHQATAEDSAPEVSPFRAFVRRAVPHPVRRKMLDALRANGHR